MSNGHCGEIQNKEYKKISGINGSITFGSTSMVIGLLGGSSLSVTLWGWWLNDDD